ncbi:collagen alpha-1(I) chain-like [Moschus berezovskii]|uniref:collagen alpha-1(I) chain-like n=1 Tax=Moschus berezovskii TaxID=68408 RepID=UPI0024441223|nr:collagen alpha-1(I) chain-like [Moschus berezovskii]
MAGPRRLPGAWGAGAGFGAAAVAAAAAGACGAWRALRRRRGDRSARGARSATPRLGTRAGSAGRGQSLCRPSIRRGPGAGFGGRPPPPPAGPVGGRDPQAGRLPSPPPPAPPADPGSWSSPLPRFWKGRSALRSHSTRGRKGRGGPEVVPGKPAARPHCETARVLHRGRASVSPAPQPPENASGLLQLTGAQLRPAEGRRG